MVWYFEKNQIDFYTSAETLSSEPKSCPECRQSVTMAQTRRIYFHLSSVIDNVQNYVEYLDTVITTKNNKLHMATVQLENLRNEWRTKLREKDHEIQRLTEKLKHREDFEKLEKLNAKIEKLKSKLREVRNTKFKLRKTSHRILINFRFFLGGNFVLIIEPKACLISKVSKHVFFSSN